MKVLLFSDIHYSLDRTLHGQRPKEALSRAITHAKRHHSDANLCLVLGDLADRGLASEYRSLAADLKILSIPYRTLLGNHDNRDEYIRVFGTDSIDDNGFVQSTIDVGPYRFILLDTHVPGQGWGSLDDNRLQWLEQTLSGSDRYSFVCMHHPPLPTALPAYDAIGLRGADRFTAVLDRHRSKIAQLFFGHCHMPIAGNVIGIPVCGIPSLINKVLPNFDDDRFLVAPNLPSAYSVAVIDKHYVTVHAIESRYSDAIISSSQQP